MSIGFNQPFHDNLVFLVSIPMQVLRGLFSRSHYTYTYVTWKTVNKLQILFPSDTIWTMKTISFLLYILPNNCLLLLQCC